MMLTAGTYRTHMVAFALIALWSLSLITVYLLVRNDPRSSPTVRLVPACVVDVAS